MLVIVDDLVDNTSSEKSLKVLNSSLWRQLVSKLLTSCVVLVTVAVKVIRNISASNIHMPCSLATATKRSEPAMAK